MKFRSSRIQSPGIKTRVETSSSTRRYSIISLYSGCGGMDLGFVGGFKYKGQSIPRLPFDVIAAYDIDEYCAETYISNIGTQYHTVDLARAKTNKLPKADVLIGGFPCQEFSICGPRRGISAERGKLYRSLVNYAKNHKPMVIVAENVSHILRLNGGKDLKKVLADFRDVGYKMYTWKMYAPDYGIPQTRDRVFLVGIRRDLRGKPSIPAPRYLSRHRNIEWAIGDLVNVHNESIPNQSEFFRAAKAKSGHGQGDEVSKRDLPGYTVRANAKSRVQFHYRRKRRLTIRECARLQTFPDDFVFSHPPTNTIMQIGNAVPPLLANKVAKRIANFLCSHIKHKVPKRKRRKN